MAPDPILRSADDRALRAAIDRTTWEDAERRIAAELRIAQQLSCQRIAFEESLKRLARRTPP
jgi:RNA polymerase-interacting CarD/CdnL/TRCF family regulator